MGPGDDRYILVSHPQPIYTNLLLSLKATDTGPGASDTPRSTQLPTHTHLPLTNRLCSRHNSWGQNGTIPILQRRKFIRKGRELAPGHTVSKLRRNPDLTPSYCLWSRRMGTILKPGSRDWGCKVMLSSQVCGNQTSSPSRQQNPGPPRALCDG